MEGHKITHQYIMVAWNCHCLRTNAIVKSSHPGGGLDRQDGHFVQDTKV